MKNPNISFAVSMFMLMISILLVVNTNPKKIVVFKTIPESKGCNYPTKEVKYIKTELKHIIPFSQVHKCTYDHHHRLIKVSTYNFELGYQMKKPTTEVLYKWHHYRLLQYSVRNATFGNGEVDVEIYRFLK